MSSTMVSLYGVNCHLSLKRTPKYLRFTCSGSAVCSRNWDALDQLDDQPRPGEQLVAAVLVRRGSCHLDRVLNGRRVGEWHQTAEYKRLEEQPADEVMRSAEKWQEWCSQKEAEAIQ